MKALYYLPTNPIILNKINLQKLFFRSFSALKLLLMLFIIIKPMAESCGQELSPPPIAPLVEPAEDTEFHQIYLDKKAKTVKCIQYKDGEPLQGKISNDGKRVLIKGYTRRSRIQIDLEYDDGSEESIEKSPCFIDPVPTS